MAVNILQTLTGGLIATVIWFLLGGALYMNPWVAKIYRKAKRRPGLKKWKNNKKYMLNMFIFGILIQSLLFAFVYAFVKPALPGTLVLNTLFFGLILVGVKILPRLFDMWLQSTYPKNLLKIELVNGTIGSFVLALVFTLFV